MLFRTDRKMLCYRVPQVNECEYKKRSLFLFYYRKSNRLELWRVLCECGVEGWLLNFHDGNKVSMNINGMFNEWFNIQQDVHKKRGCPFD